MKNNSINFDKLVMVDPGLAGQAAIDVIDRLQKWSPEQQAAGMALSFLVLCRKLKIHTGTPLGVAERILENTADAQRTEIKALTQYIKEEIIAPT